jgi:hypothetical protein
MNWCHVQRTGSYPTGPFRLQWTDKDGDNVTITSKQDVQSALGELIIAFQKQGGAHTPRLLQQNGLPPLKLQVCVHVCAHFCGRLQANEQRGRLCFSFHLAMK